MAFIRSTATLASNAVTVPNLSGGTDGRIVRISGSNIATDASNTDTSTQLQSLLAKVNGEYYAAGVVSGFTGLSAGIPYFLGVNGVLVSTPPTPSASVRSVLIGFAINSTDIIFRPGMPISGA